MKPLFGSLRNVAETIGLIKKSPFGEIISKAWRKGEECTEKDFGAIVQFTLKDIYYKDDYSCEYESKKGDTIVVVRYEVEILEAKYPIPGELLNLHLSEGNEEACEIVTDLVREELGYVGANCRLLNQGEIIEVVCAYPVRKKVLEKKKSIALFPIFAVYGEENDECLGSEFVVPLEDVEDLTRKPIR